MTGLRVPRPMPWMHRIDAVPRMRASVDIKVKGGHECAAMTVPPTALESARWRGIGDNVVYSSGGLRYLARDVEYWRYR